jgi:hypothetical protein
VFDDLSRALLQKFEEHVIIERVRPFLASDVAKASAIIKNAVARHPQSENLQKILKLLSPSKVGTRPASGFSRRSDFDWIKTNADAYRGLWVALSNGKCLAAGESMSAVRSAAQEKVNLNEVLITFLPTEKRHEAIPE